MGEARGKKIALEWGALLLVALVVRLSYLWQWEGNLFAEVAVGEAARNLGQISGVGWYSRIYAGICMALAGDGAGLWALRLVQAIVGSLSCALIWSIGARLFTPAVGRWSGAVAVLYGPAIFYGVELTPAALAVFAGLFLLWGLVRGYVGWRLAALGISGGFVALLDFRGLALLVAAWAWLQWASRQERVGWWFGAGAVAVLLPAAAYWGLETLLPASSDWNAAQVIERMGHFWLGAEVLTDLDPYRAAAPAWLLAPLMWKAGLWFPFGLLAPLALLGVVAVWRGSWAENKMRALPLLLACAWMAASMAGEVSGRSRWNAAFFLLPGAVAAVPLLVGKGRSALGPLPAWALLAVLLLAVNLPAETAPMQAAHDRWTGYAYGELGMEASAIAAYERATDVTGMDRRAYEELAELHIRTGAYASAADTYSQLLQAHGDNWKIRGALAEAHFRAGRADRAEGIWAALAELEPQPRGRLGDARAMQGDFEGALAVYRQVLAVQPDSHRVRFNVAQIWEARSQLDSAAVQYSALAEIEAWGMEAGWRLAKVMGRMQRDNLGQIEAVLRDLLARHPQLPPAALCLAGLLHRTGRDTEALGHLQDLSTRYPDDYRVSGLMAEVYEALGRDEEAARADGLSRARRRHEQVDRRVRGELEAVLQIVAGN